MRLFQRDPQKRLRRAEERLADLSERYGEWSFGMQATERARLRGQIWDAIGLVRSLGGEPGPLLHWRAPTYLLDCSREEAVAL